QNRLDKTQNWYNRHPLRPHEYLTNKGEAGLDSLRRENPKLVQEYIEMSLKAQRNGDSKRLDEALAHVHAQNANLKVELGTHEKQLAHAKKMPDDDSKARQINTHENAIESAKKEMRQLKSLAKVPHLVKERHILELQRSVLAKEKLDLAQWRSG